MGPLPAVPPAAATTTTVTATVSTLAATATTTTAFASRHGTSFVHYHGAAHELAAVASLNSPVGYRRIVDVDKAESPCFAGKPVPHYIYCVHGHTRLRKKAFNIRLAGTIRQVAHKKSHATIS